MKKKSKLTGFDAHLDEMLRSDPVFAKEYAREFAALPLPLQLALLRRRRQLSQSDVAKTTRVKQPHVARLERVGHNPSLSSIEAQARAIHCRVMVVPDEFTSMVREKIDYTEAELDKIEKLAKARGGKSFKSVRAAKAYLKSL
jgi:transcriptional regulator with XRE-family HTH domain